MAFPPSVLRTFATLPRALPVRHARTVDPDLPERALRFCPPVRGPYEQGALCFSPVEFSFRVREDGVDLRFARDDGSMYERTIPEDGYVKISDFSGAWHSECEDFYRTRLAEEKVPSHFDVQSPDYPQHLVEVTHEQGPRDYGRLISIWLGVVFVTEPGVKLLVRDPAHAQLSGRGFRVMDALVDSDRWHGNLAIGLRAQALDEWLRVDPGSPLAQLSLSRPAEDTVEHTDLTGVPQDRLVDPLRWNVFDPYRRNALRVGKYQADLRGDGVWDRDWEALDRRFAARKTNITSDTMLAFRHDPLLRVEEGRMRVVLSAEDEFESDDLRLRPFLTGLGQVRARFSVAEVLAWSGADTPAGPPSSDVVEHLQTLIRHGLLETRRRGDPD